MVPVNVTLLGHNPIWPVSAHPAQLGIVPASGLIGNVFLPDTLFLSLRKLALYLSRHGFWSQTRLACSLGSKLTSLCPVSQLTHRQSGMITIHPSQTCED